jgi:hypothetical protein
MAQQAQILMLYHPTVDLFLLKLWVAVADRPDTMNQAVLEVMPKVDLT